MKNRLSKLSSIDPQSTFLKLFRECIESVTLQPMTEYFVNTKIMVYSNTLCLILSI